MKKLNLEIFNLSKQFKNYAAKKAARKDVAEAGLSIISGPRLNDMLLPFGIKGKFPESMAVILGFSEDIKIADLAFGVLFVSPQDGFNVLVKNSSGVTIQTVAARSREGMGSVVVDPKGSKITRIALEKVKA